MIKRQITKLSFQIYEVGDLWLNLKAELTKLGLAGVFIDEYKDFIMEWAMDGKKYTFDGIKVMLPK